MTIWWIINILFITLLIDMKFSLNNIWYNISYNNSWIVITTHFIKMCITTSYIVGRDVLLVCTRRDLSIYQILSISLWQINKLYWNLKVILLWRFRTLYFISKRYSLYTQNVGVSRVLWKDNISTLVKECEHFSSSQDYV